MKILKTPFRLISICLLILLLTFCSMNVFADSEGLLIAPAPDSSSAAQAPADSEAAPAQAAVPSEEAAEQAQQQQALDAVLEPAAMPTIVLWGMLAALIMCAPIVVLVIIKRRKQKY